MEMPHVTRLSGVKEIETWLADYPNSWRCLKWRQDALVFDMKKSVRYTGFYFLGTGIHFCRSFQQYLVSITGKETLKKIEL